MPRDPRYFQIAVLGTLLTYGVFAFDFGMPSWMILSTLAGALGVQWLFSKRYNIKYDPRSPLISGLSLCLLLRTGSLLVLAVCVLITIGSKFLVRTKSGHIFNPTNIALVLCLLLFDNVWLSPGQWGSGVLVLFVFSIAGVLVLSRCARSDVSFAFLGFYAAIVFGRAFYLGDPWQIPWRQMQSGALLLFAFFMISDPKTTPQTRSGRIVFAFVIAAVGCVLQFNWINPIRNGVFYALPIASLCLPLINRLRPGQIYQWNQPSAKPKPKSKPVENKETSDDPHTIPAFCHGVLHGAADPA
jgi:Na+-transporting NADH:ubiquinone oxidoreductase subunit NqrB